MFSGRREGLSFSWWKPKTGGMAEKAHGDRRENA